MGFCNCYMFCCLLLYVHSSFEINLMGKRELVALLNLCSWCIMIVMWLFLEVPWVCLQFMFVVYPEHTHLRFLHEISISDKLKMVKMLINRKMPTIVGILSFIKRIKFLRR